MFRLLVRAAGLGVAVVVATTLAGCWVDKMPMPSAPENAGLAAVSDTFYVQISPVWGKETGYDFSAPSDVLLGREPLVYVADTGNDRVVMLDLAGNVLGQSQPVAHPLALAQDSKLRLVIANGTNRLFRIDLYAVHHDIAAAPVDTLFWDIDHPHRQFTAVAAFLVRKRGRSTIFYRATATGSARNDNAIFAFGENGEYLGPANLEPNGTGIFAAASPSGITAVEDWSEDFIFTQVGNNSFKVQWITTNPEIGLTPKLNPADGPRDIFAINKFDKPEDVTVDREKNIYVIDAGLNRLLKFTAAGREMHSFGEFGSGERQFNHPQGVAFFDRTVYVADTGNNRIVRFKLSTDVGE